MPSGAATNEPAPVLPSDADRRADQTEHLRRGFYLTEAGILAPLPAPDQGQAGAGSDGVPGIKRH